MSKHYFVVAKPSEARLTDLETARQNAERLAVESGEPAVVAQVVAGVGLAPVWEGPDGEALPPFEWSVVAHPLDPQKSRPFHDARFADSFFKCTWFAGGRGLHPVFTGGIFLDKEQSCDITKTYMDKSGSAMVWVPIYAVRDVVGGKIELRFIDDKEIADGWTGLNQHSNDGDWFIPDAFYDAGKIQPGFMYDKYMCSNNGHGVAVSVKGGIPLSSAVRGSLVGADFASLGGGIQNSIGGAFDAAKTRGEQYFPSSWQMRVAINTLTRWYVQEGITSSFVGQDWPRGLATWPVGRMGVGKHEPDGSGVGCGKTGTADPALVSHNGRASGIMDMGGLLWHVESGIAAVGGKLHTASKSGGMANFAKDLDGGMTILAGEIPESGYIDPGKAASEILLPSTGEASGAGYFYKVWDSDEPLCAIGGGSWSDGSFAGVWALSLDFVRGYSDSHVGFRAAFYL